MEHKLARILSQIEVNETVYHFRYALVLKAMFLASVLGYETGVRIDTDMGSDECMWWISFIILPGIGEVSWHNPSKIRLYDGYSTDEKYDRCHKYIELFNK